ncbi:type I restriction enzyme HsdR N-terminal domain-containing protein [Pseudomonas fluorescens]|uniref:Type I restriction enzyme HsdR N-terminal domain-containing protein n=1 Tax=Pseudomonas azadiae TaxID=2843612 RepID=A0ABS6NZU6_9PSED|nr:MULTISPECIES: type I restriction enzyme HsdR N-terminal domain-containing protein [Pseudomonas]MBD8147857.1 type I restriction enzyme HsdR N-terminal domain-containing protein [Pseudomonas fluorescens]MBD8177755.1 type I restriction enzyme HsdR N-terminal domain-containing protein [Pseudomonas fluorescens]MBD8747232.1 type I restriction enzyme HsdR N-terminal domain-containing protein [Pseudomonas fluorescens]MBD8750988.1 type I restriction enzyme HsdR N-terminal domain-containing protein [P
MKILKNFNPIKDFNLEELNNPDFKEDSVREEIILPIIKSLGYSSSRPNKILRSKALAHPFVSVGSARKKITCIPDYLFEVNEKYSWVLEAKAPGENIVSGAHVEQAYSYAIHSEIRVPLFALCNGHEFILFHISREEPLLHFPMQQLSQYFESLKTKLAPENVLTAEFKLAKDLGLHLKRLGFHKAERLIFQNIPISFIAQLDNDLFTTGTSTQLASGDNYILTLDFDLRAFEQLNGKIPEESMQILRQRTAAGRAIINFINGSCLVDVDCRVGEDLQENKDEIFLPFIVNNFI